MSPHFTHYAPIRSARFALPPPLRRRQHGRPSIAAPPATPGPGRTPPPDPVPPPDGAPPEIQDPIPPETPVPVREPPVMPPPMGLSMRVLRPDVSRTTRWTKCSLRTASEDSTNG